MILQIGFKTVVFLNVVFDAIFVQSLNQVLSENVELDYEEHCLYYAMKNIKMNFFYILLDGQI